MADKKIVLDFSPSGKCKIAAEGYTGGECLEATAAFENLFKKQEGQRVFVGDDCRRDPGERVTV